MKRIIVVAISLFCLTACASYPKPKIENGTYTNYKYEFLIDLPEGWVVKDKYPESFKKLIPYENRQYTTLLLFNNKTNGMIGIENSKSIFPYHLVNFYPEGTLGSDINKSVRKNIIEALEKRKQEVTKNEYCQNYEYLIPGQSHIMERCIFASEIQRMKLLNNGYFYGCHEDDTCFINLLLISDVLTYDENLETYNKILKSLNKGL